MRRASVGAVFGRGFILATFIVGCSSAVGTVVPTYGGATSPPSQTASVTFTITPGSAAATAASIRRPAYLSPATLSVSILPIVVGSPSEKPTIITLQASAPGCSGSGATLSCTGTATAPVGETSFTVTTYASTNGQGAILSVGTITVDVKPPSSSVAISNATSLTLSGVPASLALSAPGAALTIGTPSSVTAFVTAYDASGAAIIGPTQYTSGIALETIVPAGSDSVLFGNVGFVTVPGCAYPTTAGTGCHILTYVDAPTQAIPLSYSGEFVPGTSITLVVEAPGLASKSVPIPFTTPAPGSSPNSGCSGNPVEVCPGFITFANANSSPVPLTVSEPGVSSFSLNAYNCFVTGVASVNFSSQAVGARFTIQPGMTPGNCTATVSDAAGNSTPLNIALLAGKPTPTPSPTVMPTATPTAVPVGPITIAPNNSLEFVSSTAAPQQITASESGITSFTIDQSACAGIVSVSPTSGAVFSVSPIAALTGGGVCTFSVIDPSGQMSPVKAIVDGVSFTINSRKR